VGTAPYGNRPVLAVRGVLEGFYGRPWSWDERVAVARWCADRGMPDSVWAPKDEPVHRERWRDPWPADVLAGFARVAGEPGVRLGVGLSPGLDIDARSEADRTTLADKALGAVDAGAALVVLCLDDIPDRPGLGEDHAALTTDLWARIDGRAGLALVPTHYVGSRSTPYLSALATGVPDEVPIGWTGDAVVNDRITAEQAAERAAALGGRAPLLWDNVPVNDAIMSDRLFLGPLRGREPGLVDGLSGYLANAMVQPRASTLPLASAAAWLEGDDPAPAWAAEADRLGWRVLAEACDGGVPRALVGVLAATVGEPAWAGAAAALAGWLDAAADVSAPGLEEEAGPWLDQVRAEAATGRAALELLSATRPALRVGPDGRGRAAAPSDVGALLSAFGVMGRWPAVRRGAVSVMGVRCGFRPALGQAPDGGWSLLPGLLEEDRNAVDALVRLAVREATAGVPAEPLVVTVDGTPVDLSPDGGFAAAPGSHVEARCGRVATGGRAPFEPPHADRRLREADPVSPRGARGGGP
jgi:hyaluronoglucosaminidase